MLPHVARTISDHVLDAYWELLSWWSDHPRSTLKPGVNWAWRWTKWLTGMDPLPDCQVMTLYFVASCQNSTFNPKIQKVCKVMSHSNSRQNFTRPARIIFSLRLPAPWVSAGFVGWLVWKRSSLLNCSCVLSQHKHRHFPPGPSLANWPSAERRLCSGCTLQSPSLPPPPPSRLACFSFSMRSQEKLSPFRSKVWLWNKTYVDLKWVDFLCKKHTVHYLGFKL